MKNITDNDITKALNEHSCNIDKFLADTTPMQLKLSFNYPIEHNKSKLKQEITDTLKQQFEVDFELELDWQIPEYKIASGLPGLKNIKNIIAIASGKGGVGKSTTAVNLALALQSEGARVGILDADIYGPSMPTMLNNTNHPDSQDGKTIMPLMGYGIQFMSIGSLIDADQAMIWRGPMVSKTLQQIMRDTNWDNLDYLIIDLPPGTGDTQLTMAQKIPVTAGIIVTTPQDIALQDAKRGLQMFNKVNIPVLGIVENMSTHTCSSCGHVDAIFGQGGGAKFAQQYDLPLLGQLPLVTSIQQNADQGKPTVVAEPDSELSDQYRAIARKAVAGLSLLGRDLGRKLPPINVAKG